MASFCVDTSPEVSVIVPVYNAERWLGALIDSVSAQTFGRWECLLVDDGSTDSSAEICRRASVGDPRFCLISQPNSGVSVARNTGIENARGRWMYFADADDALAPQALERLLRVAAESGAEIVAAYYSRSESGLSQREATPRVCTGLEYVRESLYQRPDHASVWGAVFSRELFFPNGPRFTPGIRFEDLDFTYRIYEKARTVAFLPEKLYFYRRNTGSFINVMSPARLDVLDVTDRIAEYYGGTELEEAAMSRRFSAHFNILLLLLRNGAYPASDSVNRCLGVVRGYRRAALRSPRIRMKNRIGALLSYGGIPLLRLLAKFYRS